MGRLYANKTRGGTQEVGQGAATGCVTSVATGRPFGGVLCGNRATLFELYGAIAGSLVGFFAGQGLIASARKERPEAVRLAQLEVDSRRESASIGPGDPCSAPARKRRESLTSRHESKRRWREGHERCKRAWKTVESASSWSSGRWQAAITAPRRRRCKSRTNWRLLPPPILRIALHVLTLHSVESLEPDA